MDNSSFDSARFDSAWIDRYLRSELSQDEEAALETALLDSPELQDELEVALAMREALRLDDENEPAVKEEPLDYLKGKHNWQPLAMAASVLLALFSTTMYWKVSNESAALQQQVDALNQPHASVLTVYMDIMRSAGGTPDIIIQKPAANALVLLDIELSPQGQRMDSILMSLKTESATEGLIWRVEVAASSRVTVAFTSGQLPDGRAWLEMSDPQGKVFERRLMEFLPARAE